MTEGSKSPTSEHRIDIDMIVAAKKTPKEILSRGPKRGKMGCKDQILDSAAAGSKSASAESLSRTCTREPIVGHLYLTLDLISS